MLPEFIAVKELAMLLIFLISVSYVIILMISMFRNRHKIDFCSILLRDDGKISAARLAFFSVLLIITYQALWIGTISDGVPAIFLACIAGDLGSKACTSYFSLEKTKKLSDKEKLSQDEWNKL